MSVEEVADGFISVANETMCRLIRELTEAKGHDVGEHSLVCFSGQFTMILKQFYELGYYCS